jgi:2',3'-cyclic-nucleotide 2'-phosphodiesterase (5'-nucleotidase family)
MHNGNSIMRRLLIPAVILAFMMISAGCREGATGKLTVLSTNDSHSHTIGAPAEQYDPSSTGDGTIGGASRAAAVIDAERLINPDLMAFSAGDFTDGTIFITGENGAADFNLLSDMGFTAACLGNHEMGMGPEGLAHAILNARQPVIPLVCSNFSFSNDDTPEGHSDDLLESLHSETEQPGKYIFDYIIRTTPSGIKVGIFGLIGGSVLMPDALPVKFKINNLKIQTLVNKLRNKEKVDVVVCLMHAGFSIDGSGTPSGEVPDLAKNVYGIDIICSGHSHTLGTTVVKYWAPWSTWKTTIMEADDEFKYVAASNLFVEKGRVNTALTETRHIKVDDTIAGLPSVNARVDEITSDIETKYLSRYPVLGDGTIFATLAHSDFALSSLNSMNLVTDAMRGIAGTDIAVCTPGADTAYVQTSPGGVINVYEAFAAMPHSIGRDGTPGGALYAYYLKGSDILSLFELGTCLLGQLTSDLFVVPSGIRIVFDSSGTIGKRVLQMYEISADEGTETLIYDSENPKYLLKGGWVTDSKKNYSVSSSLLVLIGIRYVTNLLPLVDIWPRDVSGNKVKWEVVSDLDQFVVHGINPLTGESYEVKAWYSLAQWLLNLPGGEVPSRFNDDAAINPAGPAWRRVWDVKKYGEPY